MSPHRFFCLALGLSFCLGTSSCESPLTVQEQQRVARVIPWVNGTYALDPRQGLDYVDPMSPYRGGLRPASGFQWRSPDRNDFATVPYRGGPYLYFPKYPLLAGSAPYPSTRQEYDGGHSYSGRISENRQPAAVSRQGPLPNPDRPQLRSQPQPSDTAPAMELESAPPERQAPSPPPAPPQSVPRDKPV